MRCKFFTDWCYAYLLTFFLIIFLIYSFLFLILSPELTTSFFKKLVSYDLNTMIIGIITIVIALITLCVELKKNFERKVANQIKLIDSLLADLENISSDYSEVYGGEPTKGNLQWYKEQILLKNEMSLDHEINKISYDSYITEFESSILTKINFKKLVRTLSYINDKIREINYHTEELQKIKIEDLREALENKDINNKDEFNKFMRKVIKYGYFDDMNDLIISFLEKEMKKKNQKILAKGIVDTVFFGIKLSILNSKRVSIEKIASQKNLRDCVLGIIDETVNKVGVLKKILEQQNSFLQSKI